MPENEIIDPLSPPSPEAAEARTALDTFRRDPTFVAKFAAGDLQARAEISRLSHIAAGHATPVPTENKEVSALSADEAKKGIDDLRKNKDWLKRFAAGDTQARAEMKELHERAYGQTAEGEAAALSDEEYAKAFEGLDVDVTGADEALAHEAHQLAKETAIGLGLDPHVTRASLKEIQESIAARGQRPMNSAELEVMEKALERKWGPQLQQNRAKFAQVVRDAGRGGEWLRSAILASGPAVATNMIHTLVTSPRRSRAS